MTRPAPKSDSQLSLAGIEQLFTRVIDQRLDTKKLADPRRKLNGYPENMRIDQVAAFLNCDEKHIRNLIEQGDITPINIAKDPDTRACYRVPKDNLLAYLEKKKAQTQS